MTRIRFAATFLALTLALLAVARPARAEFVSNVKITKVYVYADGSVKAYITGNPFASCWEPSGIMLDSSYMTAAQIDQAKDFLLSAKLSNKALEINTNGCVNSHGSNFGKLDYVAFMP